MSIAVLSRRESLFVFVFLNSFFFFCAFIFGCFGIAGDNLHQRKSGAILCAARHAEKRSNVSEEQNFHHARQNSSPAESRFLFSSFLLPLFACLFVFPLNSCGVFLAAHL